MSCTHYPSNVLVVEVECYDCFGTGCPSCEGTGKVAIGVTRCDCCGHTVADTEINTVYDTEGVPRKVACNDCYEEVLEEVHYFSYYHYGHDEKIIEED